MEETSERDTEAKLALQPKPPALGQRDEETLMQVEASCSLLHTAKKAVFLLKKKKKKPISPSDVLF